METLLEWVGTLLLLGLLLVIVPIFFMLIITLQYWMTGRERLPAEPVRPTHAFGQEGDDTGYV